MKTSFGRQASVGRCRWGEATFGRIAPTGDTRRFRLLPQPRSDRGGAPLALIGDAARIMLLEEQDGGLCRSRYDQVGRTVPRGPQMSPTLDGTLADPQQIS